MRNNNRKGKVRFYAYLIFLFILILFILFNDYGLLKYMSLRSEISEINEKIENAERMLDSLNIEIEALRNDMDKIEEVARMKYNMKKSNEKPIKIEVK